MVAKAGRTGAGEIIYTAWITLSVEVMMNFNSLLRSIANRAFPWISDEKQDIPESYSSLVADSFAGDFHSFVGYYRLHTAVEDEITRNACPLPTCRMIEPSVLVAWNALKGGVDEYSRYTKSFTMAGTAENPTVTMIARRLSSQPANAALVYRLSQAKESRVRLSNWVLGYRGGSYRFRKQFSKVIPLYECC